MDKNDEIRFALYEQRLIVLQEFEDGKFRQVMLNAEQFKKMSDATIAHKVADVKHELKDGYEYVRRHFNDDWEIDADKFLGLSSIYPDEEVKCDEDAV